MRRLLELNFQKKIIPSIIFAIITALSCQPRWTKALSEENKLPMPENVLVCIDTPTEYHQKIISAITAWDESIGIWKHLIPTTNLNICDISITEVPEEQETDSRIVARAFMSNNKIHLYKGRYTKDTTGIVLHEIGHLLGAIHMEETLMAPIIVYNKYTCPDTATLAQVAISNGIDPLLFKTCASNKN